MFKKIRQLFHLEKALAEEEQRRQSLLQETSNLESLRTRTIEEVRASMEAERLAMLQSVNEELSEQQTTLITLQRSIAELKEMEESLQDEVETIQRSAQKFKVEAMGVKSFLQRFPSSIDFEQIEQDVKDLDESFDDGLLDSVVTLHLHHQDSKSLRKEMASNHRLIKKVLKQYESRYTTKTNRTIYSLMVIGLQSELQNILHTLSYSKKSKADEHIESLFEKYQQIATDGNASILPTVTRFLSDLRPLYLRAVEIEYEYYIKKEQEKEEQRQIKEQMRQEAAERKLLQEEQKKLEKEESKYLTEIDKAQEQLQAEQDTDAIRALEARIRELQAHVDTLEEQKEEIVKRANGRAGYVYVISNLGSFGDTMFKVGMTRRLNPYDRIDELGNASVPFRFDVHALVFSDNAVGLEQAIHERLQHRRVNRVNLRKEYFYTDVRELERIVQDIDSTVEFVPTMTALEYHQSESMRESEAETMVRHA